MRIVSRLLSVVAVAMIVAATLWTAGSASPAASAAPPRLKDLTITDRISGGDTVNARVILSRPAAADVTVTLTSSNPDVVRIAPSIVVRKGRTTAQTDASTVKVGRRIKVVIRASVPGSTSSETVTISPVRLDSVSVPQTIEGGASTYGTARLTDIAPQDGLVVRLNSNRPSVLQVPETVTFLGGRQTARFPITTTDVATEVLVNVTARLSGSPNAVDTTRVLGNNPTATATATASATATATAVPTPLVTVDVVTLPVLGVSPAVVEICLTDPSPSAVTVDLASSDTTVATLNVNQITLGGLVNCQTVLLTGLMDGTVTVTADRGGVTVTSQPIVFAAAATATATSTAVPPTSTSTSTPVPPTSTPIPPTSTATATVTPEFLVDFQVLTLPVLGVSPAVVQVCLTDPSPSAVTVDLASSDATIATLDVNQVTLGGPVNCQTVLLTGLLNGSASIVADADGTVSTSAPILFDLPI